MAAGQRRCWKPAPSPATRIPAQVSILGPLLSGPLGTDGDLLWGQDVLCGTGASLPPPPHSATPAPSDETLTLPRTEQERVREAGALWKTGSLSGS